MLKQMNFDQNDMLRIFAVVARYFPVSGSCSAVALFCIQMLNDLKLIHCDLASVVQVEENEVEPEETTANERK